MFNEALYELDNKSFKEMIDEALYELDDKSYKDIQTTL